MNRVVLMIGDVLAKGIELLAALEAHLLVKSTSLFSEVLGTVVILFVLETIGHELLERRLGFWLGCPSKAVGQPQV